MLQNQIQETIANFISSEVQFYHQEGINMFQFNRVLETKDQQISIFYTIEEVDKVLLQLHWSFTENYHEPGKDFYQLIEKINQSLLVGNLYFGQEGANHKLSFKSSYVGDANNFLGNNSFPYFLEISFDMISLIIKVLS